MRVDFKPQIQQPQFKAVDKEFYYWALRESRGCNAYGELMTIIKYHVGWGEMPAQDGIDTLTVIKDNLAPLSWSDSFQRAIDYVKLFLK